MAGFKQVTILGAGAFGIALARVASLNSKKVYLWARNNAVCKHINQMHHHPSRLSQISLPKNIEALNDLKEAVKDAKVIILALPIPALSEVLQNACNNLHQEAIVISTSKGIESATLSLPYEILQQHLPKIVADRACYLSGPSFAVELAMDLPTALAIASKDQEAAKIFQAGFGGKNFRLYRNNDVVGVCVGGAIKNVIAIAGGICSSLGLGKNALASLITRGLAETSRLAAAMGGRAETVSGLAGAGDLILSCTDDMSRNHRLGTYLANGTSLSDALQNIGGAVEGANTTKSIPALIKQYGTEMPISLMVYNMLYQGVGAKDAMAALLSRKLKHEFDYS